LPEPDRLLLHQYLIDAANRCGQAVAIAEDEKATPFELLLENATLIAAALGQRGLGKGDRVALILSKTTDAIAALFGTLLAGGVYVPVQPHWPAERVASTLEDCGARFVFTEEDSAFSILDVQAGRSIGWAEVLKHDAGRFRAPPVSPQDTALILFTSGSTGRPKGVAISHRAAAAFVNWSGREFGIGPDDRIACPSPLSFDLSTFDVFNLARGGATCVIVPERNVWFPRFLTEFLHEQRITAWYSVPSILAGMLNEGGLARRSYPDLRVILFAGEVFAPASVARLQAAVPNAALYNLYGPTETNVVTWYQVPPGFDGSRPVPIGRACPYARVELDGAGDEGELLAGGESLMNGYWNRPEETAAAFAEIDCKGRYYRTGDRVTVNPEGDLVFIDRMDRQVKRRGFRIELGEIEAALSRHPAVLEAAAVSTEEPESGASITAFVRIQPGHPVSQAGIKAHCARILPPYMLPDRIVFLAAVPKGSRGKTDYAALRDLVPRK
jgi:amino acid adenylation domain-containing protein